MGSVHLVDVLIIAGYFALMLAIGYWAFRKGKEESADYFLAGRDVGWLVVGASLFASNIGSEHLVGLAGSGAAGGLAVGHFEWLACLILLLLGWLFVPFYLRSGVYTMPEFLEQRYNAAARWYLATVSIIGYVLTKISVTLYAGAVVIRELTGMDMLTSAIALVIVTGLYTIAGGLRAVVYTEVIQTFVLILGSVTLTVMGLVEVGGWQKLTASLPADFFSMWKPVSHPDFPWTGIVFGAPILGIWYWCTDQYIVQRVLAARNLEQARRGTIFASFLKILPVFIFVLPGMIAVTLFQDITSATADRAFPSLVTRVLPIGLKGLVIAGLLAALMSSLSSVFNSCSTLITWDLYKKLHPGASEHQLVMVGRVATGVLVVLGLMWVPFMKYISSQLYIYLQSVQAYIAPPIAACFLFGLFLTRLNGNGAIAALLSGFVLGALRLILELANGIDKTGLPDGTLWAWLAEINFLHFAVLLFVICTAILIGVSLLTRAPSRDHIAGLTFATTPVSARSATANAGMKKQHQINILLSLVLAATIGVLWIIFA
ncbi:MAG: sodium:solute symporter [candidate division KSB1 bacterium]|nr:sodium:solute symporter [candidate division KSB1 bacterium]MDZ7276562.1 sodium:solute symporter [candidate division KSB1 bacterium]MDZ7285019.1 sodium:solute symporter [candidate division KSB1 bacterium]MDZ7298051.1 sodium:solute symporter [candidate division KSB1 bacterium]MDZ7307439.1 sodium:solute symporter [candidate division KSB1 bacterium]